MRYSNSLKIKIDNVYTEHKAEQPPTRAPKQNNKSINCAGPPMVMNVASYFYS